MITLRNSLSIYIHSQIIITFVQWARGNGKLTYGKLAINLNVESQTNKILKLNQVEIMAYQRSRVVTFQKFLFMMFDFS